MKLFTSGKLGGGADSRRQRRFLVADDKRSGGADLLTSPRLFIALLGWMSRYCNEAEREAQLKGQRASRCGRMIKRLFFLPSDG